MIDEGVLGVMIPIVAIIMGIATAMLSMYFSHRKRELIHQERLVALEKGVPVPELPEGFFNAKDKGVKNSHSYLIRGLVWLAIGIGAALFFGGIGAAIPEHDGPGMALAGMGAVPGLVGVAYLIFYSIAGKKMKEEEDAELARRNNS